MIYFLFSSAACNLSCSYCGGTPEDLCMPARPIYKLDFLTNFIKGDDDPVVVFYGGEPLMNLPWVMKVMDQLPEKTEFILQTNCTLLHKLPEKYLKRTICILCSIDGVPDTVTAYRGKGVFNKIIQNLEDSKARGFTGSIVARMACSQETDIYRDVSYLAGREVYEDYMIEYDNDNSNSTEERKKVKCPFKFDAVYWQLDAQWDSPMDARWCDCPQGSFEKWLTQSYKPGIDKLYREWYANLTSKDPLEKDICKAIVPFSSMTESLLKGELRVDDKGRLNIRCSSGSKACSITTDGRILACPVASGEKWNNIGKISKSSRDVVMTKLRPGKQCDDCDIRQYCGGRCLYANKTQWWGDEGFKLVCTTVRQIVDLVKEHIDDIRKGVIEGRIVNDETTFSYPAERYSLEILP